MTHSILAFLTRWWADLLNLAVTGTVITVNPDLVFKALAFLFVTLPLGIYQWAKLLDWMKKRRARNGQ